MNLTTLLDVAIGLTLIYLVASLFVTILNEYMSQLFKLRAKMLRGNLAALIDSPEAIEKLKDNPALAQAFNATGGSYVNAKVVAQQLVGALRSVQAGVATLQDLQNAIEKMGESKLKNQLYALSEVADDKVSTFVDNVRAGP